MPSKKARPWFPTKQEVIQCAREPVLRIAPSAIIPLGSTRPESDKTKIEHEWIPPPDTQKLKCEIQCVIQKRSEGTRWTSIQHETRFTSLVCTVQDDGKRAITIDQDAFFTFPLSVMMCPGDGGHGAPIEAQDKRDLKDYRLKLHITSTDQAVKRDLHTFLHGEDALAVPFGIQAPLRGFIRGLDDTSEKQLVELRSGRADVLEPTGYSLAVDIAWNDGDDTFLEQISKSKRITLAGGAESKETKPDVEVAAEHEITYVIKGSAGQLRSVISTDLKCQFCKRRLPHSSFERLHMHYMLNHDQFDFVVTESRSIDGIEQRTLLLQRNERPRLRASNDVPDEREMEWVRPERPFDLSQYLRGDESWTALRGAGRKIRPKSPTREVSATNLRPYGPSREKSPSEIQPLQPRKRKRYPVPAIPDVELYRSISKRQLMAGEYLSESDEDSEEDWAAQKQRFRSAPLKGASRGELNKVFDRYIHDEKISSDMHLQHAVVRFARHFNKHLRRPLILCDWKTKLQQLRLTGLISSRLHDYCLMLCTSSESDTEDKMNVTENDNDKSHLTNGHFDGDRGDSSAAKQLGRTLKQWQSLPAPAQAVGAHPLTGHPKVQQTLGFVAIHPEFQGQLYDMVHCHKARLRASMRLESVVHGRTALRVHQDDYEGWLSSLKEAEVVEVHAGTCCCGRTVDEADSLIYCANILCPTAGFHMACVNASSRDADWKCMDCAGRATPWAFTTADLQEQERQDKMTAPTLQNSHKWLEMLRKQTRVNGDSGMLK
ncbi:Hypothetical protein D9617_1g087500 [Elsinoe fawcettii]|nr:Hypothetical protein D9617_1g087500 [Elsinoe fawcettii]